MEFQVSKFSILTRSTVDIEKSEPIMRMIIFYSIPIFTAALIILIAYGAIKSKVKKYKANRKNKDSTKLSQT